MHSPICPIWRFDEALNGKAMLKVVRDMIERRNGEGYFLIAVLLPGARFVDHLGVLKLAALEMAQAVEPSPQSNAVKSGSLGL
jgi:hypothetical protein